MNKIAGVDYSLTCPGIYIKHVDKYLAIPSGKIKQTSYLDGKVTLIQALDSKQPLIERYKFLAEKTISFLLKYNVDIVHLEGYSFGSKGQVFNLAENCGVLKYLLDSLDIELKIIAPSELKKFATGKGNVNKIVMYDAYSKQNDAVDFKSLFPSKNPEKLTKPIDDLVDAYWLASFK